VTARGDVDQSLQDEHHSGARRCGRRRRGRVGEHGAAADEAAGNVVTRWSTPRRPC
jgi:hypothetical protein